MWARRWRREALSCADSGSGEAYPSRFVRPRDSVPLAPSEARRPAIRQPRGSFPSAWLRDALSAAVDRRRVGAVPRHEVAVASVEVAEHVTALRHAIRTTFADGLAGLPKGLAGPAEQLRDLRRRRPTGAGRQVAGYVDNGMSGHGRSISRGPGHMRRSHS